MLGDSEEHAIAAEISARTRRHSNSRLGIVGLSWENSPGVNEAQKHKSDKQFVGAIFKLQASASATMGFEFSDEDTDQPKPAAAPKKGKKTLQALPKTAPKSSGATKRSVSTPNRSHSSHKQ
jgi:hypothetical protein